MQTEFLDKHCMEFTNEEENKIVYTVIFNEYTKLLEEFILSNLRQRQPNIDINRFLSELRYGSIYFLNNYSRFDSGKFQNDMMCFYPLDQRQPNLMAKFMNSYSRWPTFKRSNNSS